MSELVPFFEAVMLLCFGISWPIAIVKTLRAKSVKGMSLVFLFTIATGYVSGILYKIFGHCDWVIGLYMLNLILVGFEISLYFRYSKLDRQNEETVS